MLEKTVLKLIRLFNGVAMIVLVIMMLAITADVIARYVFHHSISVVYTLTENYLMVAVVFLGLGYTHYQDDHIQFKLVADLMPPAIVNSLNVFIHLLVLLFFAVIAYEGTILTIDAWEMGESTGGVISLPMYLSYIWVPLGSFIMVLISLFKAFIYINKLSLKNTNHST